MPSTCCLICPQLLCFVPPYPPLQLPSWLRQYVWTTQQSSLKSGTRLDRSATTVWLPCTTEVPRRPSWSMISLMRWVECNTDQRGHVMIKYTDVHYQCQHYVCPVLKQMYSICDAQQSIFNVIIPITAHKDVKYRLMLHTEFAKIIFITAVFQTKRGTKESKCKSPQFLY